MEVHLSVSIVLNVPWPLAETTLDSGSLHLGLVDFATGEYLAFIFININDSLLQAFIETFSCFLHRCSMVHSLTMTRLVDLLRGADPRWEELRIH